MKHNIKTLSEFYKDIISRKKPFEVRLNDRDYKVDDILHLLEIDDDTKQMNGNECEVRVTYILDDENYCKNGYVVMAIEPYAGFGESKILHRLTTDKPETMVGRMLNMTVVHNNECFIRDWDGAGDISLVEFCKKECNSKCNREFGDDVTAEDFGDYMDCDCFVAHFYIMACGYVELRERLKYHEDLLGERK